MYEKELDFLISTSYGPGRYDPLYEEQGLDYPLPYVRWTENRNLEEYLRLLAEGTVTLEPLGTQSYPIEEAPAAYASLSGPGPKPLLITLRYPTGAMPPTRTVRVRAAASARGKRLGVALVGAGSFAEAVHLPNLGKLRGHFQLRSVVSRTGSEAKSVAVRYGALLATTDLDAVLTDPDIDVVLVTTRHDSHAEIALNALKAGKHVFVEKPLAIREEQLAGLEKFFADASDAGRVTPVLMTGFNRRFSVPIARIRDILAGRTTPLMIEYRMNAGYIPLSHWVHGAEGGGRNIGEACHIYDLFDCLTGAEQTNVIARSIQPGSKQWVKNDNFIATISYADGSVCALVYTSLGNPGYSKETMDIFADGKVVTLDDYRAVTVVGGRHATWRSQSVEKGHQQELEALATCLSSGGPWPISLEEQVRAMRIAFAVEQQLSTDA
jgi:predicted dehydrogenase